MAVKNYRTEKIRGKDFWTKDLGFFLVAKLSFCRKSEISSDVITNETKGNPFTFSFVNSDKQTHRQTDRQTDKLFGSIVCRNIGHSGEGQLSLRPYVCQNVLVSHYSKNEPST